MGGGGKGASTPAPIYTPPPAAPQAPSLEEEALELAPEEETKKIAKAQREGAKSLQIPVGGTAGSGAPNAGATAGTSGGGGSKIGSA